VKNEIKVLQPKGASEWAPPTFITPQQDDRVCWVSDLRDLNKVVKRRQYPLPIIQAILRGRTGYKFFTKLDISMQYYTFELDKESKDRCTIAIPFLQIQIQQITYGSQMLPRFRPRGNGEYFQGCS
jgi:hypothetical protein